MCMYKFMCCFFFFKQKTAYEMRISDWSSDVCSSDLAKLGKCSNPSRSAADQPWEICAKRSSSASIRVRVRKRYLPRSATARSSGMPTERFERRVESIDRHTAFTQTSIEDSGVMMRYNMGLPYLCSPI